MMLGMHHPIAWIITITPLEEVPASVIVHVIVHPCHISGPRQQEIPP